MDSPLFEEMKDLGIELGADEVVFLAVGDIVFDERSYLKCLYGCPDWGRKHTCPSRTGALKPWEYRRILQRYRWGVIVHCGDKATMASIALKLESHAFVRGRYFAFALGDCSGCADCAGLHDAPCREPDKARPSFHSVGIDVFATVRSLGLPVEVLKAPGETENWYGAVLVE